MLTKVCAEPRNWRLPLGRQLWGTGWHLQMAGILKTIWLDLRFCLRAIRRRSKPSHSGFPIFNSGPQPSDKSAAPGGGSSAGSARRFYSLIVEVRPPKQTLRPCCYILTKLAQASLPRSTCQPAVSSGAARRCRPTSPKFSSTCEWLEGEDRLSKLNEFREILEVT